MKTIQTITKEFSKDTYVLEVIQGATSKLYSISINGRFDRNYRRLPSELREFFDLKN